jgi:hypothetical protein
MYRITQRTNNIQTTESKDNINEKKKKKTDKPRLYCVYTYIDRLQKLINEEQGTTTTNKNIN